MRIRTRCLSALALAAVGLPVLLADTPGSAAPPIAWKKIVVDKVFRSEGVAVADVNRDGKLDILVGDFWYEAPDWKLHPIRRVKEFNETVKEKLFGNQRVEAWNLGVKEFNET